MRQLLKPWPTLLILSPAPIIPLSVNIYPNRLAGSVAGNTPNNAYICSFSVTPFIPNDVRVIPEPGSSLWIVLILAFLTAFLKIGLLNRFIIL